MYRMNLLSVPLLALVLLIVSTLIASADHPEHPRAKRQAVVTKENLAEAIEAYVNREVALKGGYFVVYDKEAAKPLALALDKVHKERLSKVGEGTYFACADFKTPDGKTYDLDIFMQGPNKDELEVTQITVHKEEGVARYTWYKEAGLWKMRPVPKQERRGPVRERTVEFDYSFTVKDVPADAERVLAWVPVPPSNEHQTLHGFRVYGDRPYIISIEPDYGNRFLRIDLSDDIHPGGEGPTVMVTFHVSREAFRQLDRSAPADSVDKETLVRFLAPDSLVPITGKVADEAERIAGKEKEPVLRARRLYDHIVGTLDYDKTGEGWGRGDAEYACDVRKGNCTDFHSLFIGEARSLQIPARFVIGFSLPEHEKEGVIKGYHCWAEFYLEGNGWAPIDASEASKFAQKKDAFFGGLDEHRLQFTTGRDIKVPGFEGSPVNYVVYPYIEVDGKPHGTIEKKFYFRETKRPQAGESGVGD